MAREIPEVVRAAAGLAATVLDEARRLPETLPGVPVRVIGLALQQAMRVQQQYAGLVARGDELLVGLRGADEPGLATFDDDDEDVVDPADDAPVVPTGYRESAFDRADLAPAEVVLIDDAPTGDDVVPAAPAQEPARTAGAKKGPKKGAKKGPKQGTAARGGRKAARGSGTNLDQAAEAAESAVVAGLPDDPAADAVVAAVEDVADQVEGAQQALDDLPGDAPSTEEVLEELAIDEMVGDAETASDSAADSSAADEATVTGITLTDEGTGTALDESGSPVAAATGVRTDVEEIDTATDTDTDTAEVDAAMAAGAAVDAVGADSAAATDDPEGGSEVSGSQAAGVAPVDGYDSFSIAQLRGRLRGYALSTVVDLLAYEEATRAREPYLRMLRNRLERLEAQAVEASPLAPRGV
jgi:hypothetical protein